MVLRIIPLVMPPSLIAVVLALLHFPTQQLDLAKVNAALDKGEPVVLETRQVLLSKFDFEFENRNVEAVLFVPKKEGKYPGILLIPGYQRTARDFISIGSRIASEGFVCMSVSQPGFGKSGGKSDFVGPMTMRTMAAALDRLKALSCVNIEELGVYGYSRGGMAASLLATRRNDLSAAVFGAGVYDFKAAHDESTLPGVKKNMDTEGGLDVKSIEERSSILQMDRLLCPVLIVHGEEDVNVPVSQAKKLAAKLVELKKEHELVIYPGLDHSLPGADIIPRTIAFFKRHLQGPAREATGGGLRRFTNSLGRTLRM